MTSPILVSPADYAEYEPARNWQAATPLEEAMAAGVAPPSEAVQAVVNHGRWVVQCPDCNGAQLGCAVDHRFMCNECANIGIGGLWRPVVWPERYKDLSEVLAQRKDRAMQNWDVGETVDDLRDQNRLIEDETVDGLIVRGLNTLPDYPDFEGHVHDYPGTLQDLELYTCADPVCGHPMTGRDIKAARKAGELG